MAQTYNVLGCIFLVAALLAFEYTNIEHTWQAYMIRHKDIPFIMRYSKRYRYDVN